MKSISYETHRFVIKINVFAYLRMLLFTSVSSPLESVNHRRSIHCRSVNPSSFRAATIRSAVPMEAFECELILYNYTQKHLVWNTMYLSFLL